MGLGRFIGGLGAVLAAVAAMAVGGLLDTLIPHVTPWLVRAGIESRMGGVATWHDRMRDGGLHLFLCGTGSPAPDPRRASSCATVLAGGQFFVIDVGTGSVKNMGLSQLPLGNMSAIFLTHFHSDHIADLGEAVVQSWINGRRDEISVYGPPGVSDVVSGFQMAYKHDQVYRTAHHTEEYMPQKGARARAVQFDVPAPGGVEVYNHAGVRVVAFEVDHWPAGPAVGYRFEYAGRTLVITGDTEPFPEVQKQMKGAELVLRNTIVKDLVLQMSDVMNRTGRASIGKMLWDTLDYHSSPVEAMEDAMTGDVKVLVLSHLLPAPANLVQRWMIWGYMKLQGWDRRLVLGEDGMHFSLPASSDKIVQD